MSEDTRPDGDSDADSSQADAAAFHDPSSREDRRSPPESQPAAAEPAAGPIPGIGETGPQDELGGPGPVAHGEQPAFGVMLHLLGAVALALASLVWAGLLLFGAVVSNGLKVLGVFAGLTLAVAWFAWLVRATMGREFREDESGPEGDDALHSRRRDDTEY